MSGSFFKSLTYADVWANDVPDALDILGTDLATREDALHRHGIPAARGPASDGSGRKSLLVTGGYKFYGGFEYVEV